MSLVRTEDWRPQGVTDLEPRAWEALRQTAQSVLVTAGAGAGKTEFLAQKAPYLLQTGLCPSPKRILAISFKRDAARNLAERVEKRCQPEQARRFNSYTFDAFAKSLVDRFRLGIPDQYRPRSNYRIVTPGKREYEDFLNTHKFYGVNVSDFERAVATTRLPVANEGSDLRKAVAQYWLAQYIDYDEVMVSFPMMNRLVDLLLRMNPSILKALRLTFPVVFLDEFQDTTVAQFQLLRTAFDNSGAIFTAVGDDKQSIMGWAGAMPDAFAKFEEQFSAQRISLISNWRSHADLVQIQHVIASRIDPNVEAPEARADRMVDGDIAAIWEFDSEDEEGIALAKWVAQEVRAGIVLPDDVAILVRKHADTVEHKLTQHFADHGLRLRNVARLVGDISVQDLLNEELTQILLALLHLGAEERCPESWNQSLRYLQFLEATEPADEWEQQRQQERLQDFTRKLRRDTQYLRPEPLAAKKLLSVALNFVDRRNVCQAFAHYQRQADFDRVWNGFTLLLNECLGHADTWSAALDEFEGVGQVPLMTIHKSKGLEFHTMIFYGLDNETWWSLTPDRQEELNSFFVAFTRAQQRAFFTLCTQRGSSLAWIENLLAPAGVRRIRLHD